MQDRIYEILLQQSPIIIMLCIILSFMYRYILNKNDLINKKDTIIMEQQNKLMQLYGEAIQSQNRLSHMIEMYINQVNKHG